MKKELEQLRNAIAAVLALYPQQDDCEPRFPHETMLRNVLRSLAAGGPVESELRMAIMQAYAKEIA